MHPKLDYPFDPQLILKKRASIKKELTNPSESLSEMGGGEWKNTLQSSADPQRMT